MPGAAGFDAVATFPAMRVGVRVAGDALTAVIYLPATAKPPAASSNLLAENPSGANPRVWVVNQDNDSVSVFNAANNSKITEVNVGTAPRTVAVAPDGRIWVTNKQSASISIIDPTTLSVAQTLTLPRASQP